MIIAKIVFIAGLSFAVCAFGLSIVAVLIAKAFPRRGIWVQASLVVLLFGGIALMALSLVLDSLRFISA